MKFLHVGDLHIGRSINQVSLLEDQKYALEQMIDVMEEEKVDKLIISGDLYDRQIPSGEAVALLNHILNKLINKLHYEVYIISGNHDSSDRLNFVSSILKGQGLYIDTLPSLKMSKYEIEDEYGKINIYMLPFFSPGIIRSKSGKDSIKTFQDAIVEVLSHNEVNKKERNILVAHHSVLDGGTIKRSGSESIISIGGLDKIDYKIFDDFDYVALGHFHHPQHIGRNTVRYSGSLLKYSESEIDQVKCFTIVEFGEKNDITIRKVPIKPLREFKRLKGLVNDLLVNPQIIDNDYVVIELEDTVSVMNAMQRLRVKYPNCLQVSYTNSVNQSSSVIALSHEFHSKDTYEQFEEFFTSVTDKKLSNKQKDILEDILEKVVRK